MTSDSRIVLGALLVILLVASILAIAGDAVAVARSQACSRDFQQLVHGLGLGAIMDLSQCDSGYDWRLAGTCASELGPIPGSGFRCDIQSTVCPHDRFGSGSEVGEGTAADAETP